MRFAPVAALVIVSYALGTIPAKAGVVFLENFDSGSASFTTDEPSYWLPYATTIAGDESNGYIITDTNNIPYWPSWSNAPWPATIPTDVSGTGYFLIEGTQNSNPDPSLDEFYISPTFSVDPNTSYTVSFYLTEPDQIYPASIQPEIDGNLLGSPVSPQLFFYDGWQQFSFTWNSGGNTSASLILHDYTSWGSGNDFAVDNIAVAGADPAPEPGTLALLACFSCASAVLRRKHHKG